MAKNKIQFQEGLSLPRFLATYGTEEQCQQALFKMRWPQGFRCPKCGREYCSMPCRVASPAVSGYRSQLAWFRRCFPRAHREVQRGLETDVFLPSGRDPGQVRSSRHLACTAIVREEGFLKGGLKRRVLAAVVYDERPLVSPLPD